MAAGPTQDDQHTSAPSQSHIVRCTQLLLLLVVSAWLCNTQLKTLTSTAPMVYVHIQAAGYHSKVLLWVQSFTVLEYAQQKARHHISCPTCCQP
jgi:hypothetical protein